MHASQSRPRRGRRRLQYVQTSNCDGIARNSYRNKPDLVCFDRVIVEAKATAGLGKVDLAQMINYLRVSGLKTTLLLNFGTTSLEYKKVVL